MGSILNSNKERDFGLAKIKHAEVTLAYAGNSAGYASSLRGGRQFHGFPA
ncbi:hypothetical protein [Virgibacillus pantothenticus]|nr:hypothetical protein [Virgibacillus pantothenticus]QTY16344.1 hypothetical protein KBP50_21520 [Virgibacillus pantothenticus]